jgi:DNA-binding transcriptional MerR regulator
MKMTLKHRPEVAERGFSPAQVARISGLSVYMVDYLCRTELVVPSGNTQRGRGRVRRYTFGDVVLLRVISKLLKQGISVLGFRKSFLSARNRQSNVRDLLARRYLVTDGVRVYLQNRDVLERIDTGQLSFAFVLDLAPIRGEMAQKLKVNGG